MEYMVKSGEMYKLPKILVEYMETTDQFSYREKTGEKAWTLTKEHILNEAEWCLYNAYQNSGSAAYAAHQQSKKALRRFVEKLQSDGIKPKRDFD